MYLHCAYTFYLMNAMDNLVYKCKLTDTYRPIWLQGLLALFRRLRSIVKRMTRILRLPLLWAVFFCLTLCFAKECRMNGKKDTGILDDKLDLQSLRIGDNLWYNGTECQSSPGFFTFTTVVDYIYGSTTWKSSTMVLDENCTIVNISEFPEASSCEKWTISGNFFPDERTLVINNLDRSATFFNRISNVKFSFNYGAGLYEKGQGNCFCKNSGENKRLRGWDNDNAQQQICPCTFPKNGDGSRSK